MITICGFKVKRIDEPRYFWQYQQNIEESGNNYITQELMLFYILGKKQDYFAKNFFSPTCYTFFLKNKQEVGIIISVVEIAIKLKFPALIQDLCPKHQQFNHITSKLYIDRENMRYHKSENYKIHFTVKKIFFRLILYSRFNQ